MTNFGIRPKNMAKKGSGPDFLKIHFWPKSHRPHDFGQKHYRNLPRRHVTYRDDFDPDLALKSVFDSFRLFLDLFIYLIRDQIRAFVNLFDWQIISDMSSLVFWNLDFVKKVETWKSVLRKFFRQKMADPFSAIVNSIIKHFRNISFPENVL